MDPERQRGFVLASNVTSPTATLSIAPFTAVEEHQGPVACWCPTPPNKWTHPHADDRGTVEKVINANLTGAFCGSTGIAQHAAQQIRSNDIHRSGLSGSASAPGQLRSLRPEGLYDLLDRPRAVEGNVTANVVALGYIDTDMTRRAG